MSSAVFPVLPGLSWGIVKRPTFSTKIQRAVSGCEARVQRMAYPLYEFDLSYEVLRGGAASAELQTLMGFYIARGGAFDSFLYVDPDDYAVVDQSFGTGDSVSTTFQLVRTFGGGGFTLTEPVQNVSGTPTIKVNGVAKVAGTDYTISSTGMVTFASAPASSSTITWTGSFYYRCRFKEDSADFSQFMKNIWELKKLQFVGSTMNKV